MCGKDESWFGEIALIIGYNIGKGDIANHCSLGEFIVSDTKSILLKLLREILNGGRVTTTTYLSFSKFQNGLCVIVPKLSMDIQ
jgi:hypothetical protein